MRLRLLALPLLLTFEGCERRGQVSAPPPPSPPPLLGTPAPATPPPTPFLPNKRLETARLFSGIELRTSLETEHGTTATADRTDPASYGIDLQMKVRVPKAHQDLAEITRLNERLPQLLPALASMVETAKISPSFDELYRLKVANLQRNLTRLDVLLSRHNFYDCETILEMEHSESKRRALFIQADMDVDSDGSDSDRVPEIDGMSATFQPFTSYKWPKKTDKPNSFIQPRELRLKQLDEEIAKGGVTPARDKEIKTLQAQLRLEIADLKKASFLVGSKDPFIVLPGSMFGKVKTPFSPGIGDYCVVIAEGVLYPAILGDVGPSFKMGEASTRICKQINPRSTLAIRPVSELKVTYLVFPGTAERPFDAPDLEKWRSRCEALLGEIGGYEGELFVWEDLTKPKPVPAPILPIPAVVPVPAGAVPPVTIAPPALTPPPNATPAPVPAPAPAPPATETPVTPAPATPPPTPPASAGR
jgi:hypothetical protein